MVWSLSVVMSWLGWEMLGDFRYDKATDPRVNKVLMMMMMMMKVTDLSSNFSNSQVSYLIKNLL